jgi:alkylated DNA repair dioxygenase AlkB
MSLSLFASGAPTLATNASIARVDLDARCWIDLSNRWLLGADELLTQLLDTLPWTQGRRLMWGQWLDEPRLSAGVALTDRTRPAVLREMAAALSDIYGICFDSCFCNYYRDGRDSVAWHGDRIGRTVLEPLVAIVSLGGPRQFSLRPKGGGHAHSVLMHSGDLLVMGGATQHRWEHSIPKCHAAPPRVSVTFRHQASFAS